MGVSVKRGVGVRGRDRGRGRGLSFFEKNAVLGLGFGLELVSDAVVQLADVHRSRRWHELLGGSGGMPPSPPREICKIGLSKMQFPAFPGPELGSRNYDRNHLFFSIVCITSISE